jgi:hypothetical protein
MPTLTDPLGWFTLQFPEGWSGATEDCVTTLTSPDNVGVLYVSGGRHVGGPQSGFGGPDFLLRFLEHIGVPATRAEVLDWQGVGCRMYSFERTGGDRYWRYWSITDDETALLVSYTCATRDRDKDETAVEDMVRSVRLYGSAATS